MSDLDCNQILNMSDKAIVVGPAGPASTGPLFWLSMLSAVSLFLSSANFSLGLPLILHVFNHSLMGCVERKHEVAVSTQSDQPLCCSLSEKYN